MLSTEGVFFYRKNIINDFLKAFLLQKKIRILMERRLVVDLTSIINRRPFVGHILIEEVFGSLFQLEELSGSLYKYNTSWTSFCQKIFRCLLQIENLLEVLFVCRRRTSQSAFLQKNLLGGLFVDFRIGNLNVLLSLQPQKCSF